MRDRIKQFFFPFNDRFQNWDTALGWIVFLNALVTYSLTVEPTVSFWDTGEYIATSAKLEVPHPPGAPLFQMVGAFFGFFAKDNTQVALMVNYVSCLASAFTILFLFWTITQLLGKLAGPLTQRKRQLILCAGLVGALTYTYSDSFWFNAVETEVYAMASLVMALLIWLGLKWTERMEDPRGHKWLLLIAFVVGLTFGIQFMGFLAIPSIALLFFFKRYPKITVGRFLVFNAVAVLLLMLVFKFSLTYVLKLFGWGEVFFVNQLGLPFNSGSIIVGLVLVLVFYMLIQYTRRKGLIHLNTTVLCVLFLFLGFTSWFLLPIRANVNVGINENNPSDARMLLAYYNREQYPSTESPFYGAYYSDRFAEVEVYRDDNPKYEKNEDLGKYKIVNLYKKAIPKSNKEHIGLLPRMWSSEHAENYMQYFAPLDFQIKAKYLSNDELREVAQQIKQGLKAGEIEMSQYVKFLNDFGEYIEVEPPGIWDNIRYLVAYQFNYMYFRYFMWNFVGRQNDVQGRYDGNGEWISGIGFLDAMRLGNQKDLPLDLKANKGRNTYFFLPLLLGLIGMVFQFSRDSKQFWVLFVFFMFTGLAIQFYTNPPIFQPRERDYSLVGSFYAFAIWIGMGTYGLYAFLQKRVRFPKKPWPYFILVLLAIPGLMAFQNWDDHDRSNRFTARASAKAYLDSTQQDSGAILFTVGDNDNFPLWYLQEIEEYRTDVRVIVAGYFATDWYIDQMKRKSYASDPIPSQLPHELYSYGTRDYVYHQPLTDKRWDINDFVKWIASDHPQTKRKKLIEQQGLDISRFSQSELNLVFYPTNKIRVPVNKEKVLESGLVSTSDEHLIVDYIDIDLPNVLYKNRILMLDLLANNDWSRPIYFSGGSFDDADYLWMKDYLQLDGLAYKLVPIKTAYEGGMDMGRIDSDVSLDIIKKWDWGNSGSDSIYHDPQTRKQFGVTFRLCLARLTEQLIEEGKVVQAGEIIDLAMKQIPFEHYGYYMFVEPFLDSYYKVGETQKARALYKKLQGVYQQRLQYYAGLSRKMQNIKIDDILSDCYAYRRCLEMLSENKDNDFYAQELTVFERDMDKLGYPLLE
ncbi:DUF2723 domain-containing protein [Flagellimonas myxillae]|uniref:glycosyltransferase family 117 protein n=1 Tax=Flagellimonas myxillae TaxID=2942214 RepID=UPI00201EE4A6|nr:DUF2723 domain-containing protein [Muricauda myxillae]MCL6268106.1 DUF2723 domain-containing protein [Muricauda myxillae]